ncbi:MAG: trypsin-like peptidase domain-containing protein [Leptospirales bacterium]|nr:trypsin-like peptidase domain-containing protein [Leptospirales bacterium]
MRRILVEGLRESLIAGLVKQRGASVRFFRILPLSLLALLSVACRSDEISSSVLARARMRSVSILKSKQAVGTGILLTNNRVLTCAHVTPARPDASGETVYQISLNDGRMAEAHLTRSSLELDLAVLEGDMGSVEALTSENWLARERLYEGQRIFLYGAPYGLRDSLLLGSISQTNRINTDPGFAEVPFIQTQGVSFPGTSGSGVYTWDGHLIGINRAAYGTNHSGLGLVIPSGFILRFLQSLPASQ